jgi:hypothetical protein
MSVSNNDRILDPAEIDTLHRLGMNNSRADGGFEPLAVPSVTRRV